MCGKMHNMDTKELSRHLKAALDAKGISAASASRLALGDPGAIKRIFDGHKPSFDRACQLLEALGLRVQILPAESVLDQSGLLATHLRDLESSVRTLNRLVVDAGGDPIPDSLRARVEHLTDPDAIAQDTRHSTAQYIEVRELAVAAGAGSLDLDETVTGHVAFRSDWLDRRAIVPAQCTVIRIRGKSMEPILPAGCSILVDRGRRRRRTGRIFVVRTGESVVVKRLEKDDGTWMLVSEHPAWALVAWPDDAEVIGEVRWAAWAL